MLNSLEQLHSSQFIGAKRITLREDLTTLPTAVFRFADSLEILDLSENKLTNLPDDFGKLEQLKILFLSNNRFQEIPSVLKTCKSLEMIAFKSNQIEYFPEDALPLNTKWLMLTNNQIESLPQSFGNLTKLRKLALAGNRLTSLPISIEFCKNLELARFSANRLTDIPDSLLSLPKLAWLSFSGNDCVEKNEHRTIPTTKFEFGDFNLLDKIGEGASGIIYNAQWTEGANKDLLYPDRLAIKLFKDHLTSDGFAADEIDCAMSAGRHPSLIKIVGHIADEQQLGLIMEIIPNEYSNLGQPPNFQTCTRDTFNQNQTLVAENIHSVYFHMADVLMQIHQNGVSHGDLYAHNIMIDESFIPLFGDFGAATPVSSLSSSQRLKMEQIEVRAFGCLMDDLLGIHPIAHENSLTEHLKDLRSRCMTLQQEMRPSFQEIQTTLSSL